MTQVNDGGLVVRRFVSRQAVAVAVMVVSTVAAGGVHAAPGSAQGSVRGPGTDPALERVSSVTPVADLLPGRSGSSRVEITHDGRHAIVHQGTTYDPQALLKVDLTASPAQVVGQVPMTSSYDSALAVSRRGFAYVTDDKDLSVVDVRGAGLRVVRKVRFKVRGGTMELFDLVVSPNGKFAYALADDWIHQPAKILLVLKLKKNGLPKLVRHLPLTGAQLAISRDGKRLAAHHKNRLRLLDLRKPGKPRTLGRPVKVKGAYAHGLAFGASSKDLYVVSSGGPLTVTQVNTRRAKVARRVILAPGVGSSFAGDVTVSRDGKQVVAVGEADEENTSVWRFDGRLRLLGTGTGPCNPRSVATSLRGPTAGRTYVADAGFCDLQPRLWQVNP